MFFCMCIFFILVYFSVLVLGLIRKVGFLLGGGVMGYERNVPLVYFSVLVLGLIRKVGFLLGGAV